MKRSVLFAVPVFVWLFAFVSFVGAQGQSAPPRGGGRGGGWTIPPTAAEEKSPLAVNDAVLANGKKLFASKCERCHGATAKGDGPDGDPAHAEDMDLTVAARAARNPDGVVFYKIWNGRASPKMPTFSEELTKEQVWALVAYVQTLRAKQ
jgi:mono/diheme cytochrome c family protein